MTVTVITDSSACLPVELRDRWGIRVVPLHILLDGADLRDGIDEVPEDIYARDGVSTAGTNPEELTDAYRAALADSGGDGVVAVHISAALSGTFGAAEHVATQFSGVRVVDSRSAAMGTGFAALAAARAAAGGADIDAVVAAADAAVLRSHAYLIVHRLDNLRRSGRIGSAAAWLGTALSLKPLLAVDDGKLVLAQRIRTVGKAVASMIDRVCEVVGDRPAALAVHHVANPEGAREVADALAERLPACAPALITGLGSTLALHVGAGAVAVCVDVDPTAGPGQV
ncbi:MULTISPECIES: DegV family protein [Mycolicibacter]|uniref:DegV domain-containing protein n=2 Tax=Mycolicibacter algericus TaxID=1288388 RepID=A0A7I9Y7L0_MYCAL|nr:DegV family protein [Mycolicibacter algericus]OQZ99180.1 fatty acid-binding protein DegV [Mycolicibacter algericus DSM 45454]GFG84443.1 DegV domain-containing protein [Mycolicibacter algericus]